MSFDTEHIDALVKRADPADTLSQVGLIPERPRDLGAGAGRHIAGHERPAALSSETKATPMAHPAGVECGRSRGRSRSHPGAPAPTRSRSARTQCFSRRPAAPRGEGCCRRADTNF